MKINFIKNLSDQIIKENHTLKGQIIKLKKELKNYEQQMIKQLTRLGSNSLIFSNPYECLTAYIKLSRSMDNKYTQIQKQKDKDNREIISLWRTLQELKAINQQQDTKLKQIQCQNQALDEQLQQIKSSSHSQISELSAKITLYETDARQTKESVRLLKLKLEEEQRDKISAIKMHFDKELLQFREKLQKQNLKTEKILKEQVQNKDKTIKQLMKSAQKIAKNATLQEEQSKQLKQIFKPFQQYTKNTQLISELRNENMSIKAQLRQQANKTMQLQSKVVQLRSNQTNLMSRNERILIEKIQLQSLLLEKQRVLHKSQKDKQAMQIYYDDKWNSQYNRVKLKLESGYAKKISDIQLECRTKIASIRHQADKCVMDKLEMQAKMNRIQKDMAVMQLKVSNVDAVISGLTCERDDYINQKRQIECMAHEEIIMRQCLHHQSIAHKIHQQAQLQTQIKELNQEIIKTRIQAANKIYEIEQQANRQLLQSERMQLIQKESLEADHNFRVKALEDKYSKNIQTIKSVEAQLQNQFKIRLKIKEDQYSKKLIEKEEQYEKKASQMIFKYKQIQNKSQSIKKKHEEEIKKYCEQILKLQQKLSRQKSQRMQIHRQLVESQQIRLQFIQINKTLQKKNNAIKQQVIDHLKTVTTLSQDIQYHKNQITTLTNQRQQWKAQLEVLQKEYKTQFASVQHQNQKQILFLKSKIWELEEIIKSKPMQKKDIEKIKAITSENRELENTIYAREAENAILNQVKDYYQLKLRQTETRMMYASDFGMTTGKFILTKKPKRTNFIRGQGQGPNDTINQSSSSRIFQPEQVKEMKKYIRGKRNMQMALAKSRMSPPDRNYRLNSSMN